jgi:transmembrane sensor
MPYTGYTPEDFAADDRFIRWVTLPDAETELFWREWLAQHPEQAETIREARELVQSVRLTEHFPSEQQVNRMRRQVYSRIGRKERSAPVRTLRSPVVQDAWYRNWQKVAAAWLVLLVCGVIVWYSVSRLSTIEYRTAYGETRSVELPDGSSVMLNANSVLTHSRFWSLRENREVWLTGEAFFQVRHLQNQQPFRVNTEDKLRVEVLGTEFNVFQRKSGTRVILQSGKVQLNIPQGNAQNQVLMQPGDLVELETENGAYSRKVVDPELASAWTRNKLIFDNTSIAEIVAVLEETYGLRVRVSGPELLQKRVIGSAPTDDVNVFLAALSKSFGLRIERKRDEVFIASP